MSDAGPKVPGPLSAGPSPAHAAFASAVVSNNCAFYIGAGVSNESGIPLSWDLVQLMRGAIESELGIQPDCISRQTGQLEQRSLEAIADEAAVSGPLVLKALQDIVLDAAPFRTARPNYAHRALALLLWEGVSTIFSANWDQCVELAAADLGFVLSVTVTDADRSGRFRDARYHKVHGCASDRNSLMVSTAQIGSPPAWALSEVQAALSGKEVIFLGLGTVGDYVATRIEHVLSVVPAGAAQFYVVAPGAHPSAAWAELLPDKAAPNHFSETASVFLDRLLRQLWFRMVTLTERRAQALMTATWRTGDLESNLAIFKAAFETTNALAAFAWVRKGCSTVAAGTPTVLGPAGPTLLLGLAASISNTSVDVAQRVSGLVVETASHYIEVAFAPGVESTRMVQIEIDRINDLAERGAYPAPEKPILHLCLDHDGPLPSRKAPGDLVDEDEPNLVSTDMSHEWVSIRSLLDSGAVLDLAA